MQVAETLDESILAKMHAADKPDVPTITAHQLTEPDGLIFGFPTRFGAPYILVAVACACATQSVLPMCSRSNSSCQDKSMLLRLGLLDVGAPLLQLAASAALAKQRFTVRICSHALGVGLMLTCSLQHAGMMCAQMKALFDATGSLWQQGATPCHDRSSATSMAACWLALTAWPGSAHA